MPLRRFHRKLLWLIGAAAAGLLLVWFSMPLWFPWVLRPVASTQGFRYRAYIRQSYSRFAVSGLTLTNGSTVILVKRAEVVVPSVWLWRLFAGSAPAPFVRVQGWEYLERPVPGRSQNSSTSLYADLQSVAHTFRTLGRWIPIGTLSQGEIHVAGATVAVPQALWTNGQLVASVSNSQPALEADLAARVGHGPPYRLQLRSRSPQLEVDATIVTNATGLALVSSNTWHGNRVQVQAQLGKVGTFPVTADLQASDFHVSTDLLGIQQYQELSGAVNAHWAGGQFVVDATAHAQPIAAESNLPPADIELHARGDTNSVTVERALVASSWITATLSEPLRVHFSGPLLTTPARFQVSADFSHQSLLPVLGRFEGQADFTPGTGKYPAARFQFNGHDLSGFSLHSTRFSVEGRLEWPQLEVARADIAFEDGSAAHAAGSADLEQWLFRDGQLDFHGPLLRRWLPKGYAYENISLSEQFSGALADLQHHGRCEINRLATPSLKPLNVRAEWSGRYTNELEFQLTGAAQGFAIATSGSATNNGRSAELALRELSLTTNNQPALELAQPVFVSIIPASSTVAWEVVATPLVLEGPAGSIRANAHVEWPHQGNVQVDLERVSSALLARFTTNAFPEIRVRQLAASAGWTNGPVTFSARLLADEIRRLPKGGPPITFSAAAELSGSPQGITLSNLFINSQTSHVISAQGVLPITLNPARSNLVAVEMNRPIDFEAQAHPQAFFWDELARWTGLRFSGPQLQASVKGTWNSPRGRVEAGARQIELQRAREPAAHFENLHVAVDIDRDRAQLTRGELLVQGQPVTFTAELPLGNSFWEGVPHGRLPDWQKASAQLRIADAELAAFEPLFPSLLAPQGELNANLVLKPGGDVTGELRVRNARTRPLATAGPLRNIQLDLRIHDRLVELANASLRIGGSTVSLSGHLDLQGTNWQAGGLPPFELSLTGTDIPISREPESILRSDLLLALTHTNGAPPLITGVAHLRDSFYLSDLRDLVPAKVATPSRRPPYFSVEEPLLADWRLAVQVDGARFLKVRSSIFLGEVTANLKVQGTLKDPIALGDLKIDSGTVRFPFANLQVQQGLVVLTSQDPYRPQITLNATSKQFGYDLRMDVTGPVDAPVLQFNSSPALSSDQILLMVTAGELPQGTFNLTPQQKAQTVAMFLGRDILSKFGLGDQTQQRLTISSGEEITEQGRPTYHVEYKLTDRWALEGEYDRFGDFNAGFRWRFYSK